MTNRFRTFAAAVFTLLTITAPASAATVDEAVDLNFSGGNQLVGNIDFSTYNGGGFDPNYYYTDFYVGAEPNLTFNGTSITDILDYDFPQIQGPLAHTFLIPVGDLLNIDTSDIRNLNFAAFILNGTAAQSGTVSCVSGCDINAVPLPPALPMFGAALFALGGFAAWRSRRAGRG